MLVWDTNDKSTNIKEETQKWEIKEDELLVTWSNIAHSSIYASWTELILQELIG